MTTVHDHPLTHYGAKLVQQYSPYSPSILHHLLQLVMTTPLICSSNPSADIFIPSPPRLLCNCLLSGLWQGFPPKLSSNLHSTVFQNWTLTSLKYLLPAYLQAHHPSFQSFPLVSYFLTQNLNLSFSALHNDVTP